MDNFGAKFTVQTFRSNAREDAQFVDFGRGTIHYRLEGVKGGPLVVLVHGLTTPLRVFDAMVPLLGSLGFQTLRYDHFGRGYSDDARELQDPAHFSSILRELLDTLIFKDPVHLVGYSMGGAIVSDFALRNPSRVESLGLLAPMGFGEDLGSLVGLSVVMPVLGDLLFALTYPNQIQAGAEALSYMDLRVPGLGEYQTAQLSRIGYVSSVMSSLRGMSEVPMAQMHSRIAQNNVRVRAVWGEIDPVTPAIGAETLQRINPASVNTIIDGVGHEVPFVGDIANVVKALFPTEPRKAKKEKEAANKETDAESVPEDAQATDLSASESREGPPPPAEEEPVSRE